MHNYFFSLVIFVFNLVGVVTKAQTKPKNHWQLGGSVGYAFSQQNKTNDIKDLEIKGDSVVGFVPGNYRYGTSKGFNIDLEAIHQRKSGWFNIVGLQTFISLPIKYFIFTENLYHSPSEYGRSKNSGGYSMLKLGVGYRTQYTRNANLFIGMNIMYGGGWYKYQASSGYRENWDTRIKSTYFDSFGLGLGVNAEAGTLIKLNRKMEGTIKAGYNAAMFSVWDFSKESGYNNERLKTGEVAHEFFNINFSLGIRYKL